MIHRPHQSIRRPAGRLFKSNQNSQHTQMSGLGAYGALGDPFADPSVQQASATTYPEASSQSSLLDNQFNPFAAPPDGSVYNNSTSAYGASPSGFGSVHDAPAPASVGQGNAYGYTAVTIGSSSQPASMDNMTKSERLAEIERREKMAADREKELEAREKKVQSVDFQPPNWPTASYAILYHDIEAEIPAQYRALVRRMYAICLLTWLCLVWNWLCVTLLVFIVGNSTMEMLWATCYVIFGTSGAWSWYRNLYFSLRDSTSFSYMRHLFWFFAHFVFCCVMVLGAASTGSGGLFNMFSCFKESVNAPKTGIMCVVCVIIWGINIFASLVTGRQSWQTWKSSGAEQQAQQEASSAVASVAAAGVKASVQAQVNQATANAPSQTPFY